MKNGAASLYSDARYWKPVELVSNMEEKNVGFSSPDELLPTMCNIAAPTFTATIVKLVSKWEQDNLPY